MAGGKGEGGRDGGEEGEKKGFGGGRWLSSPPAGRALSSSRFSRFIFFLLPPQLPAFRNGKEEGSKGERLVEVANNEIRCAKKIHDYRCMLS